MQVFYWGMIFFKLKFVDSANLIKYFYIEFQLIDRETWESNLWYLCSIEIVKSAGTVVFNFVCFSS